MINCRACSYYRKIHFIGYFYVNKFENRGFPQRLLVFLIVSRYFSSSVLVISVEGILKVIPVGMLSFVEKHWTNHLYLWFASWPLYFGKKALNLHFISTYLPIIFSQWIWWTGSYRSFLLYGLKRLLIRQLLRHLRYRLLLSAYTKTYILLNQ